MSAKHTPNPKSFSSRITMFVLSSTFYNVFTIKNTFIKKVK